MLFYAIIAVLCGAVFISACQFFWRLQSLDGLPVSNHTCTCLLGTCQPNLFGAYVVRGLTNVKYNER